jgi:hypothetical protein
MELCVNGLGVVETDITTGMTADERVATGKCKGRDEPLGRVPADEGIVADAREVVVRTGLVVLMVAVVVVVVVVVVESTEFDVVEDFMRGS